MNAQVCGTVYSYLDRTESGVADSSFEDTGRLVEHARLAVQEHRKKLVLIMVGLPGRGKTYLCNKLMCYLNWLGHTSKHFNVGSYRRKIKSEADSVVQDSAFFDHSNEV